MSLNTPPIRRVGHPRGPYIIRADRYEFQPTRDLGRKPFHPPIRSSMWADLVRCPRLFFYKYRLGLVTRAYQSALRVGEAYHLLHEKLATTGSYDEAHKAAARLQMQVTQEQADRANALGILPGGKSVEAVAQQIVKDFALAAAMFDFAAVHDPPEGRLPGTTQPKFEVVATEQTFRVPGQSIDVRVRPDILIKVDILLRHITTRRYYIKDHKTTGESPIQLAASLPWSFQPRLYRLAMERVLKPDQELRGVIHAIIQKPTIRLKQEETLPEYIERVGKWYPDEQQKRPKEPPYLNSVIVLSSQSYPLELQHELRELSTACGAYARPSRFPRRSGTGGPDPCIKWKTPCPYLPLCAASQRKWPAMMERLYVVEDPSRLQPGETPPITLESPTKQPTEATR